MLAPASSITLIFLMCRTLLALSCEDSGTCDGSTPRYSSKRDLSQELRKMRTGFPKTTTESPPKDDMKSKYEALLKSMNEIQEMLKHNQKPSRTPTKELEEVEDHDHKPAIDRGECSAWAKTNAAALITASKFGNIREIASLVYIGTPVDAVDETGGGRTPLHWAVRKGKVAAVQQLLELGATVNRPVPGISNTPLHIAAFKGDLEMVKLLVEHGADITALNSHCFTPLEVSNLHAHHEVSQWLQENAEKYTTCKEKRLLNKGVPPEDESTSIRVLKKRVPPQHESVRVVSKAGPPEDKSTSIRILNKGVAPQHESTSVRVVSKGVPPEDESTSIRVLNKGVALQHESTSVRVVSKAVPLEDESTSIKVLNKGVPVQHESTSVRSLSSHATSTSTSTLLNSTMALTTLITRH